ncbi:MAG: flagellar brake protein [Proteobacteria bacterium]|nr:flagellar brake protein [Burkholderiales bacterium]
MALQPLRKEDLQIGAPAPYSIFDRDRVLLLSAGCVIESDSVLDALRTNGMFSDEQREQPARPLMLRSAPRAGALGANPRTPGTNELPVTRATVVGEDSLVSVLETNLRFGDPMQVRFDDGTPARYTVRLIGAVDKRSMLITHPQVDGRMVFLREGQVLRLKALRGKYAYAFEAAVLKCQLAPFPYVHLNYPTQVRATSIRKAYRVALNGVASLGRGGETARLPCNMKDVSVAGTLLHAPRELALVGSAVEVAFRLQVSDELLTFSLPGVIRNAREAEDLTSQYRTCGVEFTNLSREQKQALQLFIYETMLNEA